MANPADAIYQLIKQNEAQFPIPAPYVVIEVGTFHAQAGTFSGLTTTVDFEPEPIEHLPNQRPTNPAPVFRGASWVSVAIDKNWRQTITIVPAPKVGAAPVILQFEIANPTSAWSVTINGDTVNAPSTQSTIKIGIWDATTAVWTVQANGKSVHDNLRIQRPGSLSSAAVGAFTIPVLPITIVYAPPADSLNKSTATYVTSETLGTTVTSSFSNDSNKTVPDSSSKYLEASVFSAGLSTASSILGAMSTAGKVIGIINTQLGKFIATVQTDVLSTNDTQLTLTQTTTDTIATLANAGGPGVGDALHFLKDVKMAWSLVNGQLRLCPLGYLPALAPVGDLQKNPAKWGVSAADAQALLALDPFVAGGAYAELPADRFTWVWNFEYGGVTQYTKTVSRTRDTKTTTTTKTYTTRTTEWDAGPILQVLGFGGKDQTTTTISNATGEDVSSTVTSAIFLVSGPSDSFIIDVYYDNLFGTFAIQQSPISPTPRLQGSAGSAGEVVSLTAAGRVYETVADLNGNFAFHSPAIPAGAASLVLGSQPAKAVTVLK